jgi:hypothetical protein
MIKLIDILNESYNPKIYKIKGIFLLSGERNISDILSDIRAVQGITVIDILDKYDVGKNYKYILSLKIDPSPFTPFNFKVFKEILKNILNIPGVIKGKYVSRPKDVKD